MSIDEELLESLASYSDTRNGFSERFVNLQLGSGSTLGVLTSPLQGGISFGWVLCHSFAREHTDLLVTEGVIARRLAASGYPALRFHCQGYGDSEHPKSHPALASHLRDTMDAVEAFRPLAGVAGVGMLGTRFGGAVAALVASRLDLKDLILVAPVVSGRRFMSEFVTLMVMSQMAGSKSQSAEPVTAARLKELMEQQGVLDYKGYALTPQVFSENSAMDLLQDLSAFDGRALIVQVSASGKPQPAIQRLSVHLEGLGARVTTRTVLHRQAALFGQKHILVTGPTTNGDLFAELHTGIGAAIAEWIGNSGSWQTSHGMEADG